LIWWAVIRQVDLVGSHQAVPIKNLA